MKSTDGMKKADRRKFYQEVEFHLVKLGATEIACLNEKAREFRLDSKIGDWFITFYPEDNAPVIFTRFQDAEKAYTLFEGYGVGKSGKYNCWCFSDTLQENLQTFYQHFAVIQP